MKMKKSLALMTTGLVCLSFLGACSTDKMADKMEDKMEMSDKKSDEMKHDNMSDDKGMKDDKMSDDKMMNDGPMAADFKLQDVTGKTYQLSELKGKKVYIKFWASWCSICLASLEGTNDFAKSAGDDTVVLSVVAPNHMGEQDEESFKKWFAELGYDNLPVLLDSEGELLKQYQVRSYPTNVFIGTDGVVAKTQAGYMDEESIEKALADVK